jgi:hypothetical protein
MLAPRRQHRVVHPRDDRAGRDRAVAATLLGDRHPLVVTLEQLEASRGQLALLAAVHAAGLALWWAAVPLGVALVVGAIGAEVLVGCRLFLLLEERRNGCRALIATGREDLPLAAIARERARLAAPQHQEQLAQAIARLMPLARRPGPAVTAHASVDVQVVRQVAVELLELMWMLRMRHVSARAVALVEQLLSSPGSPLYGDDADLLRRELGRVRYLA